MTTDTQTPEQWYFVRFDDPVIGSTPWKQVSMEEFIVAERSAGFFPKGGGNHTATGGFGGGNGRQGRVVSPQHLNPDSYDWDPEFQQALFVALTRNDRR
jgi:hypothetical protein